MMNDREKKTLRKYLPDLTNDVDPIEVLPYFSCLTQGSLDKIETRQLARGKQDAMLELHGHIIRKPNGFTELITALKAVNNGELANKLLDHLNPSSANRQGGDISQNPSTASHHHHMSPGVPGLMPQFPAPQYPVVTAPSPLHPAAASNQNQYMPPDIPGWTPQDGYYNNNPVNHGNSIPADKSQQAGPSARNAAQVGSNPRPKPTLDTPWAQLPVGTQTILRKFDVGTSVNKPEDLADLFDFVNEDIEKIRSELIPGDSFTLAIIKQAAQSRPVTLRDIYIAFDDLARIDILTELQKKTSVSFKRPETQPHTPAQDSQPVSEPQAYSQSFGEQHRNGNVVNSQKFNIPNVEKLVVKGEEGNRNLSRQSSAVANTHIRDATSTVHENKPRSCIEVKSLSGMAVDLPKKKGKFSGYNPEEILYQREIVGSRGKRSNIVSERNITTFDCEKEDGKDLETENISTTGVSAGFSITEETDNSLNLYKNDLNRTPSTISSDADNTAYDSLTDNEQPIDFAKKDLKNENKSDKIIKEEEFKSIHESDKSNQTPVDERKSSGGQVETNVQVLELNTENNLLADRVNDMKEAAEFDQIINAAKEDLGISSSIISSRSSNAESSLLSIGSKSEIKVVAGPKSLYHSCEHYVNHSYEDGKIPNPKLSINSQDMDSIKRKGEKQIPVYGNVSDTGLDLEGYHDSQLGDFHYTESGGFNTDTGKVDAEFGKTGADLTNVGANLREVDADSDRNFDCNFTDNHRESHPVELGDEHLSIDGEALEEGVNIAADHPNIMEEKSETSKTVTDNFNGEGFVKRGGNSNTEILKNVENESKGKNGEDNANGLTYMPFNYESVYASDKERKTIKESDPNIKEDCSNESVSAHRNEELKSEEHLKGEQVGLEMSDRPTSVSERIKSIRFTDSLVSVAKVVFDSSI